jgi:RNA polymerase sigma-70 factor (ECF subfamily)
MNDHSGRDSDDETLIRRHQANPDGEAATILIRRWQDRVYQWAYRVVRDHDAAMDIAQDSLVRMYGALPRYESRGTFSAWLFAIVHNRARSAIRPRALTRDLEAEPDDLSSAQPGPEEVFQAAQGEQRVLDAMETSLEPIERTALWLRSFEGMSVEDITAVLGLSAASGARGLLQTARRKLRRALAESGADGEAHDG